MRWAFFSEPPLRSCSARPPSGRRDAVARLACRARRRVRGCRRRGRRRRRRGSWKPETTPSAESSASRAPESSSIVRAAAHRPRRRGRPGRSTASRAAAVASTKTSPTPIVLHRARGSAQAPASALHDRVLVEPAGRGDVAAEAAEHLLVVDRRRRARQALVGDEAHRVRADVDDRDRAARPSAGPAPRVAHRMSSVNAARTLREGSRA